MLSLANGTHSGHFVDYVLDREDVKKAWLAYSEHDFVKQLAKGALPLEKFKNYLIQDFLFLVCISWSSCTTVLISMSDPLLESQRTSCIQGEVARGYQEGMPEAVLVTLSFY